MDSGESHDGESQGGVYYIGCPGTGNNLYHTNSNSWGICWPSDQPKKTPTGCGMHQVYTIAADCQAECILSACRHAATEPKATCCWVTAHSHQQSGECIYMQNMQNIDSEVFCILISAIAYYFAYYSILFCILYCILHSILFCISQHINLHIYAPICKIICQKYFTVYIVHILHIAICRICRICI